MSIAIPPRLPVKAGPVGPGSGPLLTEFPLSVYGKQTPQKKMQRAWALSFEVPWIAAAEDAIIERFASVDWALEDENDETIDDRYPDPDAQKARLLLEKPAANLRVGAPFYRSDLWALTARAMGICGSAFIFLDQPEALGGTPNSMLPIAPWRMTPVEDPAGNLLGWTIDKTQTDPGIPVTMDQILHFMLRRNFTGHFGVGNVESAMRKAQISTGLDDHAGMVLSAGGRLSGILSPATGILSDDQRLQLERDWRTVTEQTDAAKRLQLASGPIKFDRTTLTPAELQLRNMMDGARDDLLNIWGVPLPIIGGTTPVGLNGGDSKKYDEAAVWQGPVHHRLTIFREVMQFQLLDRWQALGSTVELEITEPEFDDDSPRYDRLAKSLNMPMTNAERREQIGLAPFGDPMLDNAIVLPATIVPYATAPLEPTADVTTDPLAGGIPQPVQIGGADSAALAAGETGTEQKAAIRPPLPSKLHPRIAPMHAALVRLRDNTMTKVTPMLQRSVGQVLSDQKRDIAARLRKHADHIAKNRQDTRVWFDAAWDAKLTRAIAPRAEAMATAVVAQINDVLPAQKAGPVGAVERVMTRGAARVTGINQTTKTKIQEAIIRGLDAGLSVVDVADLIEGIDVEEADAIGLDLGSLFDDYRAEMIARTELMDAYNSAALGSYSDAGVEYVQAIDGDQDEECAARAGQYFTTDDAGSIEDHPNGTLDWIPVTSQEAEGKARPIVSPTEPPASSISPAMLQMFKAAIAYGDREQPQPIINVPAPVVNVEAAQAPEVTVNLPAPVVNVTPVVNVPPAPKRVIKSVLRDDEGKVTGSVEESD